MIKIKVFLSVVWALFVRNLKDKVSEFGIIFLFSPFLVNLGIMMAVFYIFNKQTIMGLHKTIFIVSGFTPYLLFERTLMDNADVFSQIKSSLAIRQVKVFDAIMANSLTWLFLASVVLFCFLVIFGVLFKINFYIYDITDIIMPMIICFFIALGLSVIFAIIGVYLKATAVLWAYAFSRIFYFVSGLFFPIEAIPYSIRKYLLWNPLLHIVELNRYAFIATNIRNGANLIYPSFWAIGSLFIGLLFYLYFKDIFLKKAFE